MAGTEPVTSPDQHKPTNRKLARIGGILSILALLAMVLPQRESWIPALYLIGTAALIAAIMIGDEVLRRNGLRR